MLYQLRIYTIKHGELGEWLEDWRALIVPLRRQHGFQVIGAWAIDESDRFVWVLGYSGQSRGPRPMRITTDHRNALR